MQEAEPSTVAEVTETTGDSATEPTAAPKQTSSIDLSARPDAGWLDEVEGEVEDVERVLKCLSRDSAKMCQTCDGLAAAGELESRPVLVRCAGTKQPR